MHKNSQKRYYGQGVYFLTCNTKDRYPYFEEKVLCDIWIEELKISKEIKQFELYAFCLNYDHFHILLQPNEEVANISQIMQSFKKNISHNINRILGHVPRGEGARALSRLQIHEPIHMSLPKFQRQKSFHDHIIRDTNDYKHHFFYTQNNYTHHDIPLDWSYHSGNIEYTDLLDTLLL